MAAEVIHIFEVTDYDAQIAKGAATLQKGGLVVLPTETVYGAAAMLSQPSAVVRLSELRVGQPKPLTVHLARREEADQFLGSVNAYARRLMKKLWPGPVGLMFSVPVDRRAEVCTKLGVSEFTLYENGSIILRCPDHLVATDVLREASGPVVLTKAGASANNANDLAKELNGKVDLILDAGQPQYSKPSTLLKVLDDRYEIVRAGVYDQRIIERLLRTTVLFICSGNTCRSPMAEAIARRVLAEKWGVPEADLEKKGITVASAGTFAMGGSRATPAGVEALKDLQIDLSHHRSQPLSVELIHQADVIYTMGSAHASAVTALVPSAADKTFTLDPSGDIDDPIGGDVKLYQALAGDLRRLIEQRFNEKDLLA